MSHNFSAIRSPQNSPASYSGVAKFFHWLIALIILLNLLIGTILANFYSFSKHMNLFIIHEQFGVLVLMLALLRLSWRLTHTYPSLDGLIEKHEIILAKFGHLLLYLLMFAIPLVGILVTQSQGHVVGLANFHLPTVVEQDFDRRDQFLNIHKYLAIFLAVLVGGHALAALKHHFIDKNQILRRMLPSGKQR